MADDLPLLSVVTVYAVFLGIPTAAMYWLGHRYGRRASSEIGAVIVVRAALWSLVLSWTLLVGWSGHGPVGLVLPAWLVLGGQIVWHLGGFSSIGGMPAAWLSIACSLCAYA